MRAGPFCLIEQSATSREKVSGSVRLPTCIPIVLDNAFDAVVQAVFVPASLVTRQAYTFTFIFMLQVVACFIGQFGGRVETRRFPALLEEGQEFIRSLVKQESPSRRDLERSRRGPVT